MDPLTPQAVAAALGCAVAVITDVRSGKIYNNLTLPLIALGLAMNLSLGQWQVGLYGLGVATAVHYPLWRLGLEKGGDAKLLMAVGALLGPWFVLEASVWYALLYLPVGLAVLAVQGRLGNLIAAMRWTLRRAQGFPLGERPEPTMLRTAPVIAAAVAVAYLTRWIEQLLWGTGSL